MELVYGQGSATTVKCSTLFSLHNAIAVKCIFVQLQCIAARCIRWSVGGWEGFKRVVGRAAAVMPDMKACGFAALLAH